MDDDVTVKQWIACHPEVWVPRFNILPMSGHKDKAGRYWPAKVMREAAQKFVERSSITLGFLEGHRDPTRPAMLRDAAFLVESARLVDKNVEIIIKPLSTLSGQIFKAIMDGNGPGMSFSTSGVGAVTDGVIDYYGVESVVAYPRSDAPELAWMLREDNLTKLSHA